MKAPTQFLTNEKGEKIAVVLSIEEYEKILEELEDLEDVRAYDEAKHPARPRYLFRRLSKELNVIAVSYAIQICRGLNASWQRSKPEFHTTNQIDDRGLADDPRPPGCRKLKDRRRLACASRELSHSLRYR